ncbi:unnamed protein product [Heterobilharzia americana]|nr:unnamed protein product [Heterobilharzia americana]
MYFLVRTYEFFINMSETLENINMFVMKLTSSILVYKLQVKKLVILASFVHHFDQYTCVQCDT